MEQRGELPKKELVNQNSDFGIVINDPVNTPTGRNPWYKIVDISIFKILSFEKHSFSIEYEFDNRTRVIRVKQGLLIITPINNIYKSDN